MDIIKWLLKGDISIQYQTYRDLLGQDKSELKLRIDKEGFGKKLLSLQQKDSHWGGGYYRKKWISTHYTLLELLHLNINSTNQIDRSIDEVINIYIHDGIVNIKDICMNGMMLNCFCYFQAEEAKLKLIIDYIIFEQMPDGGFNCHYNKQSGARHSSLHSTVSLLEGINTYIKNGYIYRVEELKQIRKDCIEFMLIHRLYKSDYTGKVIRKSFTMLSYPSRWKYDILRALEAIKESGVTYDTRMQDALDLLLMKRRKDGTWPVQNKHPGEVHFDMERTGTSSRWNTLRALRTIKYFLPDYDLLHSENIKNH